MLQLHVYFAKKLDTPDTTAKNYFAYCEALLFATKVYSSAQPDCSYNSSCQKIGKIQSFSTQQLC